MVSVELVTDPYLISRSANGAIPCLPDGLTQADSRLAAKTGVDGHFHELRHHLDTESIASGAGLRAVAGRLGHADPSTTLRIYSQPSNPETVNFASVLSAAVRGSMNGKSQSDSAHSPASPEAKCTRQLPRRGSS